MKLSLLSSGEIPEVSDIGVKCFKFEVRSLLIHCHFGVTPVSFSHLLFEIKLSRIYTCPNLLYCLKIFNLPICSGFAGAKATRLCGDSWMSKTWWAALGWNMRVEHPEQACKIYHESSECACLVISLSTLFQRRIFLRGCLVRTTSCFVSFMTMLWSVLAPRGGKRLHRIMKAGWEVRIRSSVFWLRVVKSTICSRARSWNMSRISGWLCVGRHCLW